jgi:hypothetical protein
LGYRKVLQSILNFSKKGHQCNKLKPIQKCSGSGCDSFDDGKSHHLSSEEEEEKKLEKKYLSK